MNKSIKSYLIFFWIYILFFFLFSIIIKFILKIKIPLYALFYLLLVWCPILLFNFIEGRRLLNYLKKNHIEKYKELTYIPFLKTYSANSFRTLPFIYSADYLNDINVEKLKKNYRRFVIIMIVVFIGFPVFSIMFT